MKRSFFPQPKQNKLFKPTAPIRATKPATPKATQPLVEQKVWLKADEQNIMRIWFDSLEGPSFAMSTYQGLAQVDEFVCLFCQQKTDDKDKMVSHFMAHLEKHKEIVMLLSSNPPLLEVFRTYQPLLAKPNTEPLEQFKALLQQGARLTLEGQQPGMPNLQGIAEQVLSTFPIPPVPKK